MSSPRERAKMTSPTNAVDLTVTTKKIKCKRTETIDAMRLVTIADALEIGKWIGAMCTTPTFSHVSGVFNVDFIMFNDGPRLNAFSGDYIVAVPDAMVNGHGFKVMTATMFNEQGWSEVVETNDQEIYWVTLVWSNDQGDYIDLICTDMVAPSEVHNCFEVGETPTHQRRVF